MLRPTLGVLARAGGCIATLIVVAGCATPVLDAARKDYYNNNPQAGIERLEDASIPDRDRILFLMERGTLHQLNQNYKQSQKDYNEADLLLKKRDTLSVTHGASSMVINDNMLNFYGYPFERTYLHVMGALSYIAVSDWQGAGVEARRIIKTLKKDQLKEFPQDAFSRYLAGLCMELVDDPSNARVEYRKASKISKIVDVSDRGQLVPEGSIDPENQSTQPPPPDKNQCQLVCIALLNRVADYSRGIPQKSKSLPIVEYAHNGKTIGRGVCLADLGYLASKSESLIALRKAAKTGARVGAKIVVVDEVSNDHPFLGFFLYILLFAFEQPDYRHWETLPRYINVARFTCPKDVQSLQVTVTNGHSSNKRPLSIPQPIPRKGLLLVTFDRAF